VLDGGLCAPNAASGSYDREGKQVVAKHLRQVLSEASRRMAVRSSKIIAHARIPVLKLELRNGIELDVSINDTSGVSAANFLQSWVSCAVHPVFARWLATDLV
jgi:DNA polymerase sigma